MRLRMAARLVRGLVVAVAATGLVVSAQAQEKKIKIGVVFDLTGPLAGGGSELNYVGAKIILDHFVKTGVDGYNVEAVYADPQSKPDIAINESVRLLEQEKFYGEGTPMAGQNERSFPVVIQYIDDKSHVVWPNSQAQRDALLPLPKGTTYSNQ